MTKSFPWSGEALALAFVVRVHWDVGVKMERLMTLPEDKDKSITEKV